MLKYNPGIWDGHKYIKKVKFAKDVLWKDKQISLNHISTSQFKERGTELVIFEDDKKNERWTATGDALREVKILKTEGQEQQWYFPIEVFKIDKIKEEII